MPNPRPALLLAAALAAAPLAAEPPKPPAPAAPDLGSSVLRVAMSGSYEPLHAEAPDGTRTGLEAELAERLARLLGLEVRFVSRGETGMGAVEAVAAGKADVAISSITPTAERRKLVDFTRPYLVLRYRLAARDVPAAGAPVVSGRKVAVPRGPAAAAARALLRGARVVETAGVVQALALVAAGKADLAFGEDVGLLLALPETPLVLVGEPLGESPLAIAVPKGQVARYDEALAKLSGAIAELVETHQPGTPPELPQQVFLKVRGETSDSALSLQLATAYLETGAVVPGEELEWTAAPGDAPIDVSAGFVREGVGLPAALRRRVKAEIERPQEAAWARLADGTTLVFEKWRTEDECGGEESGPDGERLEYRYACGEEGWRIVAVRGPHMGSATVTTLVEGT